MKRLSPAIIFILLLVCGSSSGYAIEGAGNPPGTAGTTPEAAKKSKEDDRLPIHKQDQWQFFVSPYVWIPGANVSTTVLGHTTNVNVPWWDIVPDLFSNAIGVMGRFEAWKGRWGLFLDSYFVYLGGNVSDSAGKQITPGLLPVNRALVLSGDLKYITRAGNLDFGPRYLLGTLPLSGEKPLPVLSFELLGGGPVDHSGGAKP